MKLHWSPRSPFVRKVMIVAHERGLAERLDCLRTVVAAPSPNADLVHYNPLSKIPTLVLDDGTTLYDSPVICEFLDHLAGPLLVPIDPRERWPALRRQALGDGYLDFLLLWRNELARPSEHRSQIHLTGYRAKHGAVLDALEREADAIAGSPYSIGHVTIGCALSYLDFRFADEDWRTDHPRIALWHASFCKRPAVRATESVDDV